MRRRTSSGRRQSHDEAPATVAGERLDLAGRAAGQTAGERQAEPCAVRAAALRRAAPAPRLEDPLALVVPHARPVVLDLVDDARAAALDRDADAAAAVA